MTARRDARPRFIWQGTLIILPALILAAAGLHSLRQDRAFAEHGALLEARRHATTIAEKRLPEQLFTPLPAASSVLRWLAASPTATTPPEDPLMLALPETVHERVAFLADAAGELIHPPRINGHPIASPLDREELTPSQEAAWTEWLSDASSASDDSEGGIGPLLAAPLPDRWIAIARFRSALAARDAGQTTVAARLFRGVIEGHPDAVGETGTSLRPLAALELARISPDEGLAVLRMESARMVRTPDALTGALLDQAASLDEECALWRETFQRHEAVRALHRALTEASREPARFAGREYFSFSQLDADGQWIFVLSQDALQAAFARAIANQTLPPHFGATISIADDGRPSARTPLAKVDRVFPSLRGVLPIKVDVFLTDPQQFHAQQRERTMRIAALIVGAAASVLIGFVAAWRSFRKQQQLSEMKTDFVSSVSHELRAPIASMRLMAEELEQGAEPSRAKLRDYHHFIGQECRRLSALVENVLDFARREEGRETFEFAPIDLAALVHETVAMMEPYAHERGVRLALEIDGEAMKRAADRGALQRLHVNLLDNAIKHSKRGDVVTSTLVFHPDFLTLTVADDGPGMAAAELPRIFERFYRIGSELQRETPGVGLGLAIVKGIAEAHGGAVRVESAIGRGSRFIVELPLTALETQQSANEVATA